MENQYLHSIARREQNGSLGTASHSFSCYVMRLIKLVSFSNLDYIAKCMWTHAHHAHM